jgi:hypothetical protein
MKDGPNEADQAFYFTPCIGKNIKPPFPGIDDSFFTF